jgi:PAS domain S-box-containing protein
VVGIGAAHDSVEACGRFLASVAPGSGMGFVVVQATAARGAAVTCERLARHTPMPVVPVDASTRIEAERVYVLAPDAAITVRAGVLEPAPPGAADVAAFFRALADDQRDNAAFVVLGGPAPAVVAEARRGGGLVLVEAVGGAAGGPGGAAALTAEQMPPQLVAHLRRRRLAPSAPSAPIASIPPIAPIASATGAAPTVVELERELRDLRAQWRDTRRELEAASADLTASNAALHAVNEALQTSQAELRATRAALRMVNAELQQKVEALDAAHADLQNLSDTAPVATILLDGQLRIRRFSPPAAEVFRLIATDIGRPLIDIAARVGPIDLAAELEAVLRTRTPRELPVRRGEDDQRYRARIVPYRTLAGAVDGVVVSFVDVTTLERAEEQGRHRAEELARVIEALPASVFVTDDPGASTVTGNQQASALLRVPAGGPLPLGGAPAAPPGFRMFRAGRPLAPAESAIARAARGESLRDFEVELRFDDGVVRHLLGNAEPLRDARGQPRGAVAAFLDVTRGGDAEVAMRASEARYRTLAAATTDLICRLDRDLRYLYANPVMLTTLGRTLDEVIGKTAAELGHSTAFAGQLAAVRDGRAPVRFDVAAPDGRWFDVQLTPELDGGEVVSIVSSAREVTAQRRAEAALRASEQRYAAIFTTAPFAIAVAGVADGRLLAINPAFEAMFECAAADVLGRTSLEVDLASADERGALLAELEASGRVRGFVRERRDRAGQVHVLSVNLDLATVDGVAISISSVEDITDRTAAEAANRAAQRDAEAQRARLEAILHAVQDGITVWDMRGELILANTAAARQNGQASVAALRANLAALGMAWQVVNPDGTPVAEQDRPLRRILRGETMTDFELQVRRADLGLARDLAFSGEVVRDADGRIELGVLISHDITARKRAEAERIRLQAELAQAQKMEAVGTLAGGVAHDFNNILGGIMGGLSLLEDEVVRPGGRADLDELKGLARRGADLARQLLGFARRGKYDVKPLDLGQVLTTTTTIFSRTHRGVTVDVEVAPRLRRVLMDHVQLEQVLLNLFVNAGQAMPDGGRLQVRAHDAPDRADGARFVALVVRDTGGGMDEATRARIFEPFFTTKGPGQGTGLGLSSVYGIITHHGGTIEVETAVGAGCTFTLLLPATDGTVAIEPAPVAPVAVSSGTILIVDDEPQMVRVYGRILERVGYQVLTATGGRDAIALVRAHGARIALVILDLTMPEMSGAQTFDAMRALVPDLKVLLSSGFGAEGQAQAILARGCAGFIQKPFTGAELTAKLRELL